MLAVMFLLAFAGSALVAYGSVLGFLYVRQRWIMYLPNRERVAPGDAGFPRAKVIELVTRDGERLVAWFVEPEVGRPLILHFHGNACSLGNLVERFAILTASGAGLLAVDYRGFGGSTGAPTEAGLALDADAAYAQARAYGYSAQDIVIVGESLGSAVAVGLAAREPCAGVVLEAPFSSIADVAAARYRAFPARRLLHDHFDAQSAIGRICAPLLVVHGTADTSVPIRFGRALFERAQQPKQFMAVEGGGHQVLQLPEVSEMVSTWIAALPRRGPGPAQLPMRDMPLRATALDESIANAR